MNESDFTTEQVHWIRDNLPSVRRWLGVIGGVLLIAGCASDPNTRRSPPGYDQTAPPAANPIATDPIAHSLSARLAACRDLITSLPPRCTGGGTDWIAAQGAKLVSAANSLTADECAQSADVTISALQARIMAISYLSFQDNREALGRLVGETRDLLATADGRFPQSPRIHTLNAFWHEAVATLLGSAGKRDHIWNLGYGSNREHQRKAVAITRDVLAVDRDALEAALIFSHCANAITIYGTAEDEDRGPLAVEAVPIMQHAWTIVAEQQPVGGPPLVLAWDQAKPLAYEVSAAYAIALTTLAELQAISGFPDLARGHLERWWLHDQDSTSRGIQLINMEAYWPSFRAANTVKTLIRLQVTHDGGEGASADWFTLRELQIKVLRHGEKTPFFSRDELGHALNATAWFRLVSSDVSLRNPTQALDCAREAVSCFRSEGENVTSSGNQEIGDRLTRNRLISLSHCLDTLAFAQSETGDHASALASQEESVRIGTANNIGEATISEYQQRLLRYRQRVIGAP